MTMLTGAAVWGRSRTVELLLQALDDFSMDRQAQPLCAAIWGEHWSLITDLSGALSPAELNQQCLGWDGAEIGPPICVAAAAPYADSWVPGLLAAGAEAEPVTGCGSPDVMPIDVARDGGHSGAVEAL